MLLMTTNFGKPSKLYCRTYLRQAKKITSVEDEMIKNEYENNTEFLNLFFPNTF